MLRCCRPPNEWRQNGTKMARKKKVENSDGIATRSPDDIANATQGPIAAIVPVTPPAGSLGALLATVPDPTADQDLISYTLHLATTSHASQVVANLHRIKLGMILLTEQPKAKDGVTEWQVDQAKRLGILPRQLRNVLGAAKAVRTVLATQLPITAEQLLDRPLTRVVAAVNAIKHSKDPDADRATRGPRRTAAKLAEVAIEKLVAAVNRVPAADRQPLIDKVTAAMEAIAVAASPGGTPSDGTAGGAVS